jgi:hypothetical protein
VTVPTTTTTTKLQPQQWQAVSEPDSLFLALFPHRFDYLWAEHPDPGERPDWQTESRYPLSDRLLQQGAYLYGVRFGKLTRYCVLDIDKQSAYHPTRDPLAIQRMVAALEAIGLVSYVAVTSSYSGGLHVYFPFAEEQESWAIALVVSTLLEQAGFKLKPGQLEIFPNPRPYINGTPSLYTGHRVPMQAGSYLLNQHWEPVYSDQAAFVRQWQWAEGRNDLNHKTLERVLKQAQRRRYKSVTVSAQKFLNDLDTEIEPGWTGTGQTNRLLGRIAMREYIFGHVLRGGAPLTDQALTEAIVEVARTLPGYAECCRHQHEIHKLASAWARDIEASPKYYPYDPSKRAKTTPQLELQPQNNIVSFNQQLALDAETRIKGAIATLQTGGNFPTGATARAEAIIAIARCSNQTLHKYKALWHPDYTETGVVARLEDVTALSKAVLSPLEAAFAQSLEPLPEGSLHPIHPNKFVAPPAAPSEQAEPLQEVGGAGGFSTVQAPQAVSTAAELSDPALKTQDVATGQVGLPTQEPEIATTKADFLSTEQATLAPSGASSPMPLLQPQSRSAGALSPVASAVDVLTPAQAEKRQEQHRREESYRAKMSWWLTLNDSILFKEAQAWFAARAERTRSQLAVEEPDPGG